MIEAGEDAALGRAAGQARRAAYAPYSRFQVGAALATGEGRIVSGCNVENASYGLTICAERVALFTAVALGLRDFTAIAISSPGGVAPCGACRQVMLEFNPDLLVLRCDEDGDILAKHYLSDLLPDSFGPRQLDKE